MLIKMKKKLIFNIALKRVGPLSKLQISGKAKGAKIPFKENNVDVIPVFTSYKNVLKITVSILNTNITSNSNRKRFNVL
jgi:hypothetical protein